MAWELDASFVGRYYGELTRALSRWTREDLSQALANDDYARNPRMGRFGLNARWHREHSAKWFKGRQGYYLQYLATDTLVDTCIERIERTATEDNGGWAIWIDKDGLSRVESSELDAVSEDCSNE